MIINNNKIWRFHFAISYSHNSDKISKRIAEDLRDLNFDVFYDKWYEHEFFSKNGVDYFNHIFTDEARFCIVLINKEYDESDWPKIEREIIQSRNLISAEDILLPVMLTKYRPKWLPSTRIYYDYFSRGHEDLIKLLNKKISLSKDVITLNALENVYYYTKSQIYQYHSYIIDKYQLNGNKIDIYLSKSIPDNIERKILKYANKFGLNLNFILDII